MNWLQSEGAKPDVAKAIHTPIGAASPLWWAFAATASAGVAYWWMTRWAKPFNLEAVSGSVPALPALAPALEPVVAEAVEAYEMKPEAIEEVLEAPDAVAEAVIEAAPEPEPVVEAVVEAVAEAVEPVIEAIPEPDDLTRLVGIGPKLAVSLAARGVTRYADIAKWGEAELTKVDKELGLMGRPVRDSWVAQAKRFAAETTPVLPD